MYRLKLRLHVDSHDKVTTRSLTTCGIPGKVTIHVGMAPDMYTSVLHYKMPKNPEQITLGDS